MLKIRLQRVGRKHEPVFRLVAVDSRRAAKTGRVIEILGSYDSRRGEKAQIRAERIKHRLKEGAQLSPTVHNLLVAQRIIIGRKINVLPKSLGKKQPPPEKTPPVSAAAPVAPPSENSSEPPLSPAL